MDAVLLGRIGYDLYSEEPHVPLKDVRRFSRYLGGSSANMAVGLARLGMRVGMVAAVSADALGDFLVEFLAREGVDTRHVRRVEGCQSSLCLTEISPPDRFPQVFYRKEAADTRLRVGSQDLAYIARARMFVTNGTSLCAEPSRGSTFRALRQARRAGRAVVFDVDYRAMSWKSPAHAGREARRALACVDVLIGNEEELSLVAGAARPDEALEKLRRRVTTVVLKRGAAGVRLVSRAQGRNEDYTVPPLPVEVVSTIGAGDGFAAGFLYALLRDMGWRDCLRYGNAAAAVVVSRLSCSEAMPTLEELERMLGSKVTAC